MKTVDILVIGGGLSGAATALGLMRRAAGRVVLLDEQLPSQRLSRGNFGLTWFMCKGTGNPDYARWCRMAARQWPEFAAQLKEESGYDVELEWTGGAVHAFGEDELKGYADSVASLTHTCAEAGLDYPVRILNRAEFADIVPEMTLGDEVSGAMYTKEQGHVNPLKLLAAMRCAFQRKGGEYRAAESARAVVPLKNGTVKVTTSRGDYLCGKVVIAAGHGSSGLVAALGEKLAIYPQRGQLMVTERHKRLLRVPLLSVRQTVDGTFMIGLSSEDTALDTRVTPEAMQSQAKNAIRLFPMLGKLNWVRSWGAIRVMTPDGAPIYSRIPGHENITVLALHSAVSLAPLQASDIAAWILDEGENDIISHFSNGRFHV
ncbi:NAD(P)/FAD-dependent oxidoreductase [Desulfoluna butyratoxydans]|uniref:Fad dependent oxidoreductase n=1 Tax=Desulfoluna butyratoxydans TaxID=231438 RepID=A0A4U8YST4_9BACT|nr:FAD-binding oxidoreductase [Desulfoluna butyratoxydans]VFQ46844.1 fad dependent oxidoreductase [Desulfoluna butyratoxydans]